MRFVTQHGLEMDPRRRSMYSLYLHCQSYGMVGPFALDRCGFVVYTFDYAIARRTVTQ